MKDLLLYLDARLGESGTWASIAVGLTSLHLNIDPGLMQQATTWGIGISVGLGVLMKEAGNKSASTVAADALSAAAGSIGATKTLAIVCAMGVLLGLSACGTQPVQQTVYETAVGLTAAEQAAFQYASLPRCPVASGLCSDAATVATIKTLDNVAYAAVKKAEASGASADIVAMNAGLAALSTAIPGFTNPVTAKN